MRRLKERNPGPAGPVWERQPGESVRAYRAFIIYRDMGPRRSVLTTYQVFAEKTGARHVSGNFNKWRIDHEWPERARAWDNYIQGQRDRIAVESEALWEKRRQDALERNYDIAQKLREKAGEMLGFPLKTMRAEDNGRRVVIKPARWSFADVGHFYRLAAEMEAAALVAASREPDEMTEDQLQAVARVGEVAADALEQLNDQIGDPPG